MPVQEPVLGNMVINFIFSPIGFAIAFIIIASVGFLFLFKKFRGIFKSDFKTIPLESILRQQYTSIIKVTKIRGSWGSLRKEDQKIGKIVGVGKVHYTTPKNPKSKKNKKIEYEEKDLYIFKLSFNPNIPIIRNILDATIEKPKFAIAPVNNVRRIDIEKGGKLKSYFNIDPNIPVFSFADVYLYGYYSRKLNQDVSWNYAREKEMEELVNYAKRIVFLEASHSKRIDTFEELEKLEKDKYNSRLGSISS